MNSVFLIDGCLVSLKPGTLLKPRFEVCPNNLFRVVRSGPKHCRLTLDGSKIYYLKDFRFSIVSVHPSNYDSPSNGSWVYSSLPF